MQFKSLPFLLLLLLSFTSLYSQVDLFPIEKNTITFKGKIINHTAIQAQEGKLYFFDAISGFKKYKAFTINTNGVFNLELDLLHATYGKTYFEIDRNRVPVFLLPGEKYEIEMNTKEKEITFLNGTGILNKEIKEVQYIIEKEFKTKFNRYSTAYNPELNPNESSKEYYKKFEDWVIPFLNDYAKQNNISPEARSFFLNKHKYKTATSWVVEGFDYESNTRTINKNLPKDFYINVHNAYPINVKNAFITKSYNSYLHKVGLILNTPRSPNLNEKIEFFRNTNSFSEKELTLIRTVFSGNKDIKKTKEFKDFFNKTNANTIDRLKKKFAVNKVLIAVRQFPKGIGRDLLITQFVSGKYFRNIYIEPSKEEWKDLENLIENEIVFNELKQLASDSKNKFKSIQPTTPTKKEKLTVESLSKKYLEPYLGKVVYIDFWATWCGPCRREEPHAKKLHREFKNDDVVFLNLCCQSKASNWNDYIQAKNPSGEHFLLSNDEFRLFAEMYNLKGFPTYVLIDKDGKLKSADAYWPSDAKRVIRQIDKLLR